MRSGSSVVRKYIAWHISRLRCCKKVYCLVRFQDPLSWESNNLSPWVCDSQKLSCWFLRMCFYTSWQHFANMISPAQTTMPASTISKFCARTRSECPDLCFIDLISWRICGTIEPWSECLPERMTTLGEALQNGPTLTYHRNVTRASKRLLFAEVLFKSNLW